MSSGIGKVPVSVVSDSAVHREEMGPVKRKRDPLWFFSHAGYTVFVWDDNLLLRGVQEAKKHLEVPDMWIVLHEQDSDN